eukprot:343081-Pelagomonas_calceolata.AAC.6
MGVEAVVQEASDVSGIVGATSACKVRPGPVLHLKLTVLLSYTARHLTADHPTSYGMAQAFRCPLVVRFVNQMVAKGTEKNVKGTINLDKAPNSSACTLPPGGAICAPKKRFVKGILKPSWHSDLTFGYARKG